MPEGDSIRHVAARLAPVLEGAELRSWEAPLLRGPRPGIGTSIRSVDAAGKHLVIRFADGIHVRVHLGMTGSWHLYRADERWRVPGHLVRLAMKTDDWAAVCIKAPTVSSSRRPQDGLDHLGPDLSDDAPDLDAALDRMERRCDDRVAVADALLDQRIACGVGNVFKSEICNACGVSPFVPVVELDTHRRRQLLETAHRFLVANRAPGPRRTVPGGLAVYDRVSQGCRRCGGPVRSAPQGPDRRVTFWCTRCQPAGARGPGPAGGENAGRGDRAETGG